MNEVKTWAVDTGVRAVKTCAQTLVALFGATAFNVLHNVPWGADLGVALGAGVVSVLQNVQSFPIGAASTPDAPADGAAQPPQPPAA